MKLCGGGDIIKEVNINFFDNNGKKKEKRQKELRP